MSPVRILILLGLLYVLFKLLIKAGKGDDGDPKESSEPPRDVLKEDPVCRTLIPARQAIILKNNGNTIYFCSSDCRSKFIATQGDQL